jgi:hypothetical protein
MIKELLKIIFSADKLISQHWVPDQVESTQLILSCAEDLAEIDEKIRRHFQEDIEK